MFRFLQDHPPFFCSALERVRQYGLYDVHPQLDFHSAFFTIAVKSGSSERIHVDCNDQKLTWTWIIVVGDWEGGEFCIPQLSVKIPLHSGQVFAVMSGLLAHFSAPVSSGTHIIMTCFSERNIVTHTQ